MALERVDDGAYYGYESVEDRDKYRRPNLVLPSINRVNREGRP